MTAGSVLAIDGSDARSEPEEPPIILELPEDDWYKVNYSYVWQADHCFIYEEKLEAALIKEADLRRRDWVLVGGGGILVGFLLSLFAR